MFWNSNPVQWSTSSMPFFHTKNFLVLSLHYFHVILQFLFPFYFFTFFMSRIMKIPLYLSNNNKKTIEKSLRFTTKVANGVDHSEENNHEYQRKWMWTTIITFYLFIIKFSISLCYGDSLVLFVSLYHVHLKVSRVLVVYEWVLVISAWGHQLIWIVFSSFFFHNCLCYVSLLPYLFIYFPCCNKFVSPPCPPSFLPFLVHAPIVHSLTRLSNMTKSMSILFPIDFANYRTILFAIPSCDKKNHNNNNKPHAL